MTCQYIAGDPAPDASYLCVVSAYGTDAGVI